MYHQNVPVSMNTCRKGGEYISRGNKRIDQARNVYFGGRGGEGGGGGAEEAEGL